MASFERRAIASNIRVKQSRVDGRQQLAFDNDIVKVGVDLVDRPRDKGADDTDRTGWTFPVELIS